MKIGRQHFANNIGHVFYISAMNPILSSHQSIALVCAPAEMFTPSTPFLFWPLFLNNETSIHIFVSKTAGLTTVSLYQDRKKRMNEKRKWKELDKYFLLKFKGSCAMVSWVSPHLVSPDDSHTLLPDKQHCAWSHRHAISATATVLGMAVSSSAESQISIGRLFIDCGWQTQVRSEEADGD